MPSSVPTDRVKRDWDWDSDQPLAGVSPAEDDQLLLAPAVLERHALPLPAMLAVSAESRTSSLCSPPSSRFEVAELH